MQKKFWSHFSNRKTSNWRYLLSTGWCGRFSFILTKLCYENAGKVVRSVHCVGWMKPRVKGVTGNFLTEIFLARCPQKSSIFRELWKTKKVYEETRIIANDIPCASPVCLFLMFADECAAVNIKNTITLANDCVKAKLTTAWIKFAKERYRSLMQGNNLYWITEPDFMTENFMMFIIVLQLLSKRSFDRFCVGKV